MTKKNKIMIGVISGVLALAVIICAVVLLTRGSKETIAEADGTYDANYTNGCSYPHDEAITLDGKLDEDIWQDKEWFVNTFVANINGNMPVVKVTSYLDKYGVYIASEVTDTNLTHNGQRSPVKNSNWEFYVSASNADETRPTDRLYSYQYNIDMLGDVRSDKTNFERGVTVDGELNSGATKGATLEMFIPWQEFDVDASEKVPEQFGILVTYRPVLEGQSNTVWMSPIVNSLAQINDHHRFGVNGYLTPDAENAVVGDNKYSYAKSGNWDISQESEGILKSSYGTEHHKIFFKEHFASDFIVETTMIPVKALENDWPKAGIMFVGTDGVYQSVILDLKDNILVNGKNGTKNVSEIKLTTLNNNEGGWNQKEWTDFNRENTKATSQEGVKLTVIKNGGKFWYFVNDEYIMSQQLDFMDFEVFPGLYALGCDVTFKDYSCEEMSTSETTKYLNERGIYQIQAKASSGGSVETSKISVKKGETYDLTITCKTGYEVESILINDKECIADAKQKAVEGVYTVTGANSNQNIQVKFKKVEGTKLYGTVQADKKGIAADILVTGVSNGLLRYEVSASASKGYNVVLPSGKYNVLVTANGYRGAFKTVNVSGETELNFTVEPSDFVQKLTVNGTEISSIMGPWDFTKEHSKKVSTSFAKTGKMAPIYFKGTGKDFVATTTINYTTNFVAGKDYQPDLMGGFVFNNGKSNGWVVTNTNGIVHTGWKFVRNLTDTTMLAYPDKKTANMTVAKCGSDLNVYFDGVFACKLNWSDVASEIGADEEVAVALYAIMDKESDIEFSNYSIQFGTSAAKNYISSHALKDGTVANSPFATVVTVNNTPVKSMLGRWDLTNVSKNYVTASYDLGSKQQPLYFAKTATNFAVEAKIEYTTNFVSGVDYQKDLMGGFAFTDGKNVDWIVARSRGYARTSWKFANDLIDYDVLMHPAKRSVKFAVVKQGEKVSLYYDGKLARTMKWSEIAPNISAKSTMAIGLYMITDKAADIKFSNYKLHTGDAAVTKYIADNKLKDGPVVAGSLFANAVTVNGRQLVSKINNWDLSQAASNIAMGSYAKGTKVQPLYFNQTGSTVLVETLIEYTTDFKDGVEYQPDLMGGFEINDGVNSGFIMVAGKDLVYTDWIRTNGVMSDEVLYYPTKKPVKMTLALENDVIYVFLNNRRVATYGIDKIVPFNDKGSTYAFALRMVADKTADIKFSETSITTDATAVRDYIASHQ